MKRDFFAIAGTVLSLIPSGALTATGNGTGVDLEPYDGAIAVAITTAAPSGTNTPTMTVTFESSADNSTSWTAVSGVSEAFTAAGTRLVSIQTNKIKRYLRAVRTISGTNPSFNCACVAVALKRDTQAYA